MTDTEVPLRIGFVPEHFSTPLHFAQNHFSLSAKLIPFPSGTGHMITSLRAGEIDVGIGLTEGWVAGLGKSGNESEIDYKIVGTYVETPLCMIADCHFVNSNNEYPKLTHHTHIRLGNIDRLEKRREHYTRPRERENWRIKNRKRKLCDGLRLS